MRKKRRMIARPQKYGKKYAHHPTLKREVEVAAVLVEPNVEPAPIVVKLRSQLYETNKVKAQQLIKEELDSALKAQRSAPYNPASPETKGLQKSGWPYNILTQLKGLPPGWELVLMHLRNKINKLGAPDKVDAAAAAKIVRTAAKQLEKTDILGMEKWDPLSDVKAKD